MLFKSRIEHFLKSEALEDQDNALSVTRVVYDGGGTVVGFFTLCADSISRKKINHDHSGVPGFHYPCYPAIKLARMATDRRYEGRGVGKLMLNYSLSLARILSKTVGCRFLTLDGDCSPD